jgi:hypothetical protein
MMTKTIYLTVAMLAMAGLFACNGGAGSNPLIGTWDLAQPNPPVENQSPKSCYYTRWVFTPNHSEGFAGQKTGGPAMIRYTIEGKNIFVSGPLNDVPYTMVSQNQMYWSSAYGRCFYTRGK